MIRLYANENFPQPVVAALRALGHDVLTSQDAGNAGQSISDEAVLRFATEQGHALLAISRSSHAVMRSSVSFRQLVITNRRPS
jgi:hypothetical protein